MKLCSVWECAETKKIVLILNCKFNYCVNGKRDLSVMTCSEFLTWKQWNPKREMVIYTWPESERFERIQCCNMRRCSHSSHTDRSRRSAVCETFTDGGKVILSSSLFLTPDCSILLHIQTILTPSNIASPGKVSSLIVMFGQSTRLQASLDPPVFIIWLWLKSKPLSYVESHLMTKAFPD